MKIEYEEEFSQESNSKMEFDELLNAMSNSEQFSHLQVIIRRDKSAIGKKYLMVTRNSFGLVKLLNVEYLNERIILHLQDTKSGDSAKPRLNIYDNRFKFLLINWKDIVSMVHDDQASDNSEDDLLDFSDDNVQEEENG